MLVAEENGDVIGCLSWSCISQLALAGDFARLSGLCARRDLQGNGIGQRLEAQALALTQPRGWDRIEPHCQERRYQAHRFEARQGDQDSPRELINSLDRSPLRRPPH